MDLTKDIILNAAKAAECGKTINWGDTKIDLNKFNQATLSDLVLGANKELKSDDLKDKKNLETHLKSLGVKTEKSWGVGRMLLEIFEETVEENLINLELFHGPTAAFKDFGLQLAAAFFNEVLIKNNKSIAVVLPDSRFVLKSFILD